MSDSVNNSNGNGGQPNQTQGQPASQPSVDMSNVTGAEAVALAKEAKETGKSIEEIYAAKQGKKPAQEPQRGADGKFQSAQPKEQSNQEAIKEAAQEAKRKLKIKYEDREEEVDEEEVLKVYKSRKSHQQAANKELQEGKAARKQAEEFLTLLDRDWETVL